MNLKILKRRVEMFDLVCKGFHVSNVIDQLAEKYNVPEKCLWSDWERREKWIPIILSFEKYSGGFADEIETKLTAVQKAAWTTYMRTKNDNARVGALKIVLDSLELHSNTVLSKDILQRLENVEELAEKKNVEDKKH